MKNILKIFILAMLSVACVMTAVACSPNEDGGSGDKGLLTNNVKGVYNVYKYVDDGRQDTTLDIGVELAHLGEDAKIKIKSNAFSGNDTIEKLIVPSSVATIEEGAFAGMKALKEIVLPYVGTSSNADATYGDSGTAPDKSANQERTFGYLFGKSEYDGGSCVPITYNGTATENRYMPSTLRKVVINAQEGYKIPMDAFNGCVNLTEIKLSSGITEIGEYAFSGCINLTTISVPETVKVIHKGAFAKCIRLPETILDGATVLETIGESAFEGAFNKDHPAEITLPANITINKKAFSESFVKTVSISGQVLIGDSAFADCVKLVSVIFDVDSTGGRINQFAFKGASKLTQFGDTANKIDYEKFTVENLAFDN